MAITFEDGDIKIEKETVRSEDSFIFFLRNFPTGVRAVTARHKAVIAEQILPFLRVSGTVCAVYGFASRKGEPELNRELSAGRMFAVLDELFADPIVETKTAGSTDNDDIEGNFFGEAFAKEIGVEDGDDDPRTRVVQVFLWPNKATKAVVFADKPQRDFAKKNPPDFSPVKR